MTSKPREPNEGEGRKCAECDAPVRIGAGDQDPLGCVMMLRRGGLICLPCARRCACGAEVPPASVSIIDAATDRVMCDACAIRMFTGPIRQLPATDFSVRQDIEGDDPRCAAIRLSECPRCDARPGQRCHEIDRDDQVHIERVWSSARRWSSAN